MSYLKTTKIRLCEHCEGTIFKKVVHRNDGTSAIHYFCSKKCKLAWIFEKIKEGNVNE